VTDESRLLFVEVPLEWDDVDGTPWFDDEPFAPSITVSANVDNFWSEWTEPGLFFGVSAELAELGDIAMLLQRISDSYGLDTVCEYAGRFDYSDALYTGQYDLYRDCDGKGVFYISLAALPEDGSFLISVQVQLLTQADAEVLDRVLDSFIVLD
jgi:serine protease Do